MTVGEAVGENSISPLILSSLQQLLNRDIAIYQFRNKNYFTRRKKSHQEYLKKL